MPLIRNGKIAADCWRMLGDDEPAPSDGAILVSLERFQRDENALLARSAPLGVCLKAGQHPEAIAGHLGRLALVALEFPKFRDGRAYSQARLLREQYGFRGTLRATGDVLRDQFSFLVRAGFDSFEVKKPADAAAFAKSVARYSVVYQPGADGSLPALRRRLQTAATPKSGETA